LVRAADAQCWAGDLVDFSDIIFPRMTVTSKNKAVKGGRYESICFVARLSVAFGKYCIRSN
jgi:hypothetical protein